MYLFRKEVCTEPMVGIVHHCAIMAALTNGWPYTFISEASNEPS